MSDDTPTQRFPSAGDDVREDLQEEKQKSKGLLIGLIAAGALLLVAIIVLVFFLGRATGETGGTVAGGTPSATPSGSASPEPTASDTPSATPTPEASDDGDDSAPPPPPPPPTGAAFTTFNPKSQVACSFGGPGFTPDPPAIEISWKTVRADSAWIVQGTSDAADSGFMQIPLNGNQSDFQYTIQFPCFQANAVFTITLVGSDGHHVSKSWTVTNTGDKS